MGEIGIAALKKKMPKTSNKFGQSKTRGSNRKIRGDTLVSDTSTNEAVAFSTPTPHSYTPIKILYQGSAI